jgi:hypothetical protein
LHNTRGGYFFIKWVFFIKGDRSNGCSWQWWLASIKLKARCF